MIGITKLLTGKATVSAALRSSGGASPAHLLQFSDEKRPVVVWNSTRRCNLDCLHCYAEDDLAEPARELSTEEAAAFIRDLAAMRAPVVLFSGGEPLMREDVYGLGALAAGEGLRPVLSTNGTLVTAEAARRLKGAGFVYVGVSLDGTRETHDRFRNRAGAFDEALAGLRESSAVGLRTGVRFTLTRENFHDLEAVLDLVEGEGINRFCMYHLVYAGRARGLVDRDVTKRESRRAVETLMARALRWAQTGVEAEILTADNHADGILLLGYVQRHQPSRAGEVRKLLSMSGGCSAGRKIAAVAPGGDVYACQFWSHEPLGNVRERKFSDIWRGGRGALLAALRGARVQSEGRCRACAYRELCAGCRIRAFAAGGDVWGEDPQCYLTDAEIGVA